MGPLQGPSPVSEPLPCGGHAGRHWERPSVLRLAALTPRKSFPSSPDVRRVGTVFPLLKFTKTRTQPCPQPSRRTPAEATADPGSGPLAPPPGSHARRPCEQHGEPRPRAAGGEAASPAVTGGPRGRPWRAPGPRGPGPCASQPRDRLRPQLVGGVSGVAGARGVGAPRLPGACVVAQVPTGEGRAVWPSGPSGPCGFAVPLPRTARLRRENPGSPRLR